MPGRKPRSKAFPPLFLLRAGECCPDCGEGTNAFALLASGLYDGPEDGTFSGPLLLKDIERLPRRLAESSWSTGVRGIAPGYRPASAALGGGCWDAADRLLARPWFSQASRRSRCDTMPGVGPGCFR